MKKITRIICLALVLACVLCACSDGADVVTTTSSSATTTPTTKPITPTEPTLPQLADQNRPLPTLPEKKVTDQPAAGDLVLARDGVAMAVIVYPNGHSRATSAAKDLQGYLQKITGGSFTLVADNQTIPEGNRILVGPTQQTFQLGVEQLTGYPKSEKYIIRTIDNNLVLYGNDDGSYKCTQFAVTRFLEEAGCGWFSENEQWQVVPEKATLAVKEWDQTFQPLFDTRDMGGIPSALSSRWQLGGDNHQIGHALNWLVGKRFVDSNPEWYPEIGGVRPVTVSWYQFCYTNPHLAEYVAQKVIEIFDRSPYQTNYSIAANDGWDEGWCECEVCTAAGNQTDQMLVFANRVAEIVSQKYPDRTVSILAYHSTFVPPTNQKAHKNVEVMFCVETNPFTDPTLDWVVHEGFNGMTRVEYTQSWQDNVYQYINDTGLQNKAIWAWFCISGESTHWSMSPWVQGNTVTRTFQLYQEMGITRVFADCSSEVRDLRWPLLYVYARSMWDDTVDAETILYDACIKLYGDAADEMFLYYRVLADCAAICITDDGLTWIAPQLFNVYGDYLSVIRPIHEQAAAAVEALQDPIQQERARYQLSAWKYVELVM